MDNVKAKALENTLAGKLVGGFQILKLLDHGKSAAVFLSSKDKVHFAIKIFDDELISKYGDEAQFERIRREIKLKDSPHENLVNIVEGGICPITSNHFIVMEFIEGRNLKSCLSELDQDDIWHYILQLAAASKHLEDLGYAHRDIKPENIMINVEKKKLTLMDLGVIKPIKGSDLTDFDGYSHFIGTLQYSSPEYLLRCEEDTPEGWRALTFYQIGAVLHDMIVQTPIFKDECEPYACLVVAIKDITPTIKSDAVDQDLIHLAQCCLLKRPQQRLSMLSWDSFSPAKEPTSAKSRIMRRTQLAKINPTSTIPNNNDDETIENELKHRVIDDLKTSARLIVSGCDLLPKVEVTSNNDDRVTLVLNASPEIGIESKFHINVKLEIISSSSEALNIEYSTQNSQDKTIYEGTIFKGIYNKENLYNEYEKAIYESIDLIIKDEDHG